MNIEDLTEDFEILIVAWLKSGDENATNLANSLAKYATTKQLPIHGVGNCLPTKDDKLLGLKEAVKRWDLKPNTDEKQAFVCGWNNCYRYIKDFVLKR